MSGRGRGAGGARRRRDIATLAAAAAARATKPTAIEVGPARRPRTRRHCTARGGQRARGANQCGRAYGRDSANLSAQEAATKTEASTGGAGSCDVKMPLPLELGENGAEDQMELIKAGSRRHHWHWNEEDKSPQCLVGDSRLEVCFHPQCSESAAAIRGSEPLKRNGNYYYWEVTVLDKAYGTSVMFGLCTKNQRLHADDYCNLVGLDANGWSVSHKGLAWHANKCRQYTRQFPANQPVTVGLLFNTMRGELSYFMNGRSLGTAFSGLNEPEGELYPVIGSTAKCTRMRLDGAYCGFVSLRERSCFTLLKAANDRLELIENLRKFRVPKSLIHYMVQTAQVCDNQTETTELERERKLADWPVMMIG